MLKAIIASMKRTFAFALCGTLTLPLHAQPVVQAATAQLQPQISRDADGYTACGIRAIVLDVQPKVVDAYDFSLYLRREIPAGTVKAGKHQTPFAKFSKGSLKNELIHHQRYATRVDAQAGIQEYIESFYNRQRRHSRIGYIPPAVFAEQFSRQQQAA